MTNYFMFHVFFINQLRNATFRVGDLNEKSM